jgi:hypothetical protein
MILNSGVMAKVIYYTQPVNTDEIMPHFPSSFTINFTKEYIKIFTHKEIDLDNYILTEDAK